MSKQDTRQKLIDSATRLFIENGYNGASIRAITKDADINLSMVSYHFGGKEALYMAVLESHLSEVAQTIDTIEDDASMSATMRLKTYFYKVSDVISSNQYFATLFMMELNNPTSGGKKITQKYFTKFKSFVVDTIEKGVRDGEFRSDIDTNNIAFFFIGIMNFYNVLYNYFSVKDVIPMKHFISDNYPDDAFKMLLDGIKS